MLVLPIKIWILALFAVLRLLFNAIQFPELFWLFMLYYLITFLPYLVWAIPRLILSIKHRGQIQKRRAKFQGAQLGPGPANTLHRCKVCQRTEVTDPDLDFRVDEKGDEYCLDHLE